MELPIVLKRQSDLGIDHAPAVAARGSGYTMEELLDGVNSINNEADRSALVTMPWKKVTCSLCEMRSFFRVKQIRWTSNLSYLGLIEFLWYIMAKLGSQWSF